MRWLAVAAALTGCSGQDCTQPASPYQREESEVREVVLRDLLKAAKPGDVCFIAFQKEGGDWSDPPPEFLERLQMAHLTLRKASEALLPKDQERDPENPDRYQGIRDPVTGKRCYVYYVDIESITPELALIEAGMTGGPLSGGGYKSTVVREHNGWVIRFDGRRWVH